MAENNSYGSKKTRSSSSSTSYISSLSDELLVEILCRLGSSKYATRCKCICKHWFSLINSTNSRDSYFLRRWQKINLEYEAEQPNAILTQYTLFGEEENDYYSDISVSTSEEENDYNYSATNNSVGADNEEENDDYYSHSTHRVIHYLSLFNKDLQKFNPLNFLPCNTSHDDSDRVTPIRVLASVKDLVLCCPNENDHSVYYICNPLTRQWVALPPSPLPSGYNNRSVWVGLVVSDDEYGNDLKYKVVRILFKERFGNNDMTKVEIFSSDDNSSLWRTRDISLPAYCYYRERVVSYDGMLVWRTIYLGLECFILFPDDNVCANTDANYTLLPLPVGYNKMIMSSHIGVCMGCLKIGQLVDNNSNLDNYVPKLIIWELNRHSLDWELVHELDFCEVDLPDLLGDEYLEGSIIMAFHPRDRDIWYLEFVLNEKSMTCICNVREKTVELIRDIPIRNWKYTEVFPLQIPSWPSTIPLPSLPPELENRH